MLLCNVLRRHSWEASESFHILRVRLPLNSKSLFRSLSHFIRTALIISHRSEPTRLVSNWRAHPPLSLSCACGPALDLPPPRRPPSRPAGSVTRSSSDPCHVRGRRSLVIAAPVTRSTRPEEIARAARLMAAGSAALSRARCGVRARSPRAVFGPAPAAICRQMSTAGEEVGEA